MEKQPEGKIEVMSNYGKGAVIQLPNGNRVAATLKRDTWAPKKPGRVNHQGEKPWIQTGVSDVDPLDLVGIHEILERTHVKHPESVHNWRKRYSDFPKPLAQLSCGLVWNWTDIKEWLIGRGFIDGGDYDIWERDFAPLEILRDRLRWSQFQVPSERSLSDGPPAGWKPEVFYFPEEF